MVTAQSPTKPLRLRFSVFEVNLASRELFKSGTRIRIQKQPFEILCILLEHPGAVVTRDELRKRLWPDNTFVEYEDSLNTAVRKLRAALSDKSDRPQYVETVPGQGYRFIAPVGADPVLPPDVAMGTSMDEVVGNGQDSGSSNHSRPKAIARSQTLSAGIVVCLVLVIIAVWVHYKRSLHADNGLFTELKTTQLTSAGHSFKAAISPEGRYIAHTVLGSGQESLRVRQAKSLDDIEVVPPQPGRFLGIVFSADGQTIYFVHRSAANTSGELYEVPVIGGSSNKLKEDLASGVSLSPDGKRFAFVRETALSSSLIIGEFGSNNEQIAVSRTLPVVLDYPAWSPDGSRIAYTLTDSSIASPTGSGAQIVELQLANRSERVVSSQRWGFIKELAWLHDGRGLVMSARGTEESGLHHLWYVSYPEGAGRQLTQGMEDEVGASVTDDAREIVTVQEKAFSSIWQMAPSGGKPRLVASGKSGSSAPQWTAAGQIVFEEELDRQRSIWLVNSDGSRRIQITRDGNSYDHSVSSDGKSMAFISDRSGVPSVWMSDLKGEHGVMVTKATGQPDLSLSPDGKWIAVTAIGSRHWPTLWRVPATAGAQAIQLNEKLWLHPAISPDGMWIAGFYDDHLLTTQTLPSSIAVISSSGGQPAKVFPISQSVVLGGGLRWSHDSRQLNYIQQGSDGDNIFSLLVDTGGSRQVTHLRGERIFSFDWSPDGKELVLSRGILERDVVVVEDATKRQP